MSLISRAFDAIGKNVGVTCVPTMRDERDASFQTTHTLIRVSTFFSVCLTDTSLINCLRFQLSNGQWFWLRIQVLTASMGASTIVDGTDATIDRGHDLRGEQSCGKK